MSLSLRTKYLLAAALSVLGPLLLYLLFDTALTRSALVRAQAASLRTVAELLASALADEPSCPTGAQPMLRAFSQSNPDLEVLLIDAGSRICAASDSRLIGQEWSEEGIRRVLEGTSQFDWSTMEHHGTPVLDVTLPRKAADGQVVGAVHLARSLRSVHRDIGQTRLRHIVFVAVVALAVGAFLSLMTYRLVIRRLGRLDAELLGSAWTRAEGSGDEIDRLGTALRGMLADLTRAAKDLQQTIDEKESLLQRVGRFNEQLEAEVRGVREQLLATQRELLAAEHLAPLGQLSAGLAHELRNPLFIIRASAESFARQHATEDEIARDIFEEVDRINRIITRLLDLARPLALQVAPIRARELLSEVASLVSKAAATPCQVDLRVDCPEELMLNGDPALLQQALLNLATNACEVCGESGTVVLEGLAEADGTLLAVRDDGPGIAAADLPRLFEPFFSRKPHGTGLGLASAKKVFDLHQATIRVESRPGEGTRFLVRFPEGQGAKQGART